jgi:hypothetical protein
MRSTAVAFLLVTLAVTAATSGDAIAKPGTHTKDPKKKRAQEKSKSDASSKADKPKEKKPAPLPPLPDGKQVDFDYDGSDVGHAERAWWGRAWVHPEAAKTPDKALPIFVFLHGTNTELIKYRWIGAGNEGDVRRMVSTLIDGGKIQPILVAAPSQIKAESTVNALTAWPAFDLDHFLEKATKALKGIATIDRTKVIVAGHSGGACNPKGGVFSALQSKGLYAALIMDGCMSPDLGVLAGSSTTSKTHVAATWQTQSWDKRPFDEFLRAFERTVKKNPAGPGVVREAVKYAVHEGGPHDAMVHLTMDQYLPLLVPARVP